MEDKEKHCPTCICGRRAPVQSNKFEGGPQNKVGPGTISWSEHLEAWTAYCARYGSSQSAERLAERGGFGFNELCGFLGHEPTTWAPRGI